MTIPFWLLPALATAVFVAWHYHVAGFQPAARRSEDWLPVVRARLAGGLLFGAAGWALAHPDQPLAFRLPPAALPATAWPWLVASAAAIVLVSFQARSPRMWTHYPDIRTPGLGLRPQYLAAAAQALYLLGYELLFRHAILSWTVGLEDFALHLSLHTSVYVLAHLHKPAGETWGCFAMGPVFAMLAWHSGGPWLPWLVHSAIASQSERIAGRSHPQLRWVRPAGGRQP